MADIHTYKWQKDYWIQACFVSSFFKNFFFLTGDTQLQLAVCIILYLSWYPTIVLVVVAFSHMQRFGEECLMNHFPVLLIEDQLAHIHSSLGQDHFVSTVVQCTVVITISSISNVHQPIHCVPPSFSVPIIKHSWFICFSPCPKWWSSVAEVAVLIKSLHFCTVITSAEHYIID